ncbi:ABC transporter substrate-binding protein [Hydrogenophaga sp. BPS33]|uniref:ABC transporter substrate-binding protein n=1 Tax=Hydrogenophaga sp. BPS33 TaxID=2651974 RepID=UPI00131FEB24|nr:ABC transporter substrate-binding protein [Hydrogenophaga sp. BPS33]QHE84865.1 ABC transporter substrate-binding protein [Hydrogenophaga sp. BPS33]
MKTIFRPVLLSAAASLLSFAHLVQAQETPGVTAQSLTIGQMNSTTGPLAIYGVPLRDGADAYVKMVNAKGGVNGRQIKLVAEDNAFSTPQAIAVTRKMVSSDKIFALINSNGNAQVAATLPYLLEQQKTPIFGPYGGLTEWFSPPRKGLFGMQVLYEDMAKVLGQWAAKEGRKKVIVVHIEGATFAKAAAAAEPAFKNASAGASIEMLGVKLPTQDYTPIALQIMQKKPDAIIAMQTEAEFAALARELANQGVKLPVYAWAPIVTQKTIERGGPAVNGVKAISWTRSPFGDSPAIKEYRAALEKYVPGAQPDFVSLFSYGQTKLFLQAVSQVQGPLTHDSFYNALYKFRNHDGGIFPPVTFSPDRHLGLTSVLQMEIKNGAWVDSNIVMDAADVK